MAKQKFTHFVPRDQPKKRPGVHKKSQNKSEKSYKNLKEDIKDRVDNGNKEFIISVSKY